MNTVMLANAIGVSSKHIERLLTLPPSEIFEDSTYQQWLNTLDEELLRETLPAVRDVYEAHLPALVNYLRAEHNLTGKAMTATTLGNWVLGFLHHKSDLGLLLKFHSRLPKDVLEAGLPGILEVLSHVTKGQTEWIKAMCILSLPLMTSAA